jgi:hypothetical protein
MHFSSAVAGEALPGLQQEDPGDRDHSACLARQSHRAAQKTAHLFRRISIRAADRSFLG